ncbi:uncharacterized protein METZ01_LOCUS377839, partial [marine metagenome]
MKSSKKSCLLLLGLLLGSLSLVAKRPNVLFIAV